MLEAAAELLVEPGAQRFLLRFMQRSLGPAREYLFDIGGPSENRRIRRSGDLRYPGRIREVGLLAIAAQRVRELADLFVLDRRVREIAAGLRMLRVQESRVPPVRKLRAVALAEEREVADRVTCRQ